MLRRSKRGIKGKMTESEKMWVHAPADGELYRMEEIPDEVFSTGVLGRCIGIMPSSGTIYAPCDGTVASVTDTRHAMGIVSESGEEYLLHVGIDTVRMNGDGFKVLKEEGSHVTAGEPVLEADLEKIRSAGYLPMVILVRIE